MDKKRDWIIGIGGSDNDGVNMYRFTGTTSAVKKELVRLVKEARDEDANIWDFGTEDVSEMQERSDGSGSYYAYACFSDYHIDYEATPLAYIMKEDA